MTSAQATRAESLALPALIAILICTAFGAWFAHEQIILLDPRAAHAPWRLFLGTALRVGPIALLPCFYSYAYFRWQGMTLDQIRWQPLLGLLPLLLVFAGIPLVWALRLSLALFLLTLAVNTNLRSTFTGNAGNHWLAFAIMVATHIMFNGYFSPLSLPLTPFHLNGGAFPEQPVINPTYRAFVWLKQFSLSDIDYAYWAAVPTRPLSFASPLLQLMDLLSDAPSIDITAFYRQVHWLFFIMSVIGSMGFYLLLRVGLHIRWSLSVASGMVYFFIQEPFFDTMMGRDLVGQMASLAVLPLALCVMMCALRKNSAFLAALSGVTLGTVFLLMVPHPEIMFYTLIFYGILTIGACFSVPESVSLKDCIRLIFHSGLWFTLMALSNVGPPALMQMTGEFFMKGHNEPGLTIFQRMRLDIVAMTVPHMIVAFKSYGSLSRSLSGREKVFPAVVLGLIILLVPQHSPLLAFLSGICHFEIDLAVIAYYRRACYIAIFALLLVAYAMDRSSAVIAPRSVWFITLPADLMILLFAAVLSFAIAFHPRTEQNPGRCPYYVTLEALLANYPLLKGDASNLQLIRDRLAGFERDIKAQGATGYDSQYRPLMEQAHVASASGIADGAALVAFAHAAAPVVDWFYTDRSYQCVHPAESKFDIGQKFYLIPNLTSLFTNLQSPFLRLAGFMIGQKAVPHITSTGENDPPYYGMNTALFMHNATISYDARYMVGPVMLHALYLLPGYDFQPLGTGFLINNEFRLTPDMLMNPAYRTLMNIAGFDVLLMPRQGTESIDSIPGLAPWPPRTLPLPDLNEIKVMTNEQSYGVAYLANAITYVPKDEVAPKEAVLRDYLENNVGHEDYFTIRNKLYEQLATLSNHAIILEAEAQPSADDKQPPGTVDIRNILGEATVMKADCLRSECELVYNMANMPGWHATVDGEATPIERANYAFMAIRIPRGTHEVWFVYAPVSSLWFSLITLASMLFLPCWYVRLSMQAAEGSSARREELVV